jgi:EF hand domain-containing protein
MKRNIVFLAAGAAILLVGQARLYAAERLPPGLPASAALLLRFDANHDGVITREEMEAGLKADFAAADTDGNGCLNPAEVRAENERRLRRDGPQASPVVDWNLDGCVDMKEFSTAAHSYFDLADRTKDGRVTELELRGPSMPLAPRVVETPRVDASAGSGRDSNARTTAPPAPTGPRY